MSTSAEKKIAVPEKYIRELQKKEREILNNKAQFGRELPAGTKVLFNPECPDIIREDTPGNRRLFREKDFTWTEENRKNIWFKNFPENVECKLKKIEGAKEKFHNAVEKNLFSARGKVFPVPKIPWWYYLIPTDWEPKIKNISQSEILTDDIIPIIKNKSNIPQELVWPDKWEKYITKINKIKVYSLEWNYMQIDIVSAFINQLKVEKNEETAVLPLDNELLTEVKKIYHKWSSNKNGKAAYCYYTLGTINDKDINIKPFYNDKEMMLIAKFRDSNEWDIERTEYLNERAAVTEFIEYLEPETFKEKYTKIKKSVDMYTPGSNSVTAEKISNETGYRKELVKDMFFVLQEKDSYSVYQRKENLRIIKQKNEKMSKNTFKSGKKYSFIRNQILRIAGALIWTFGFYIKRTLSSEGSTGFFTIFIAGYIIICSQRIFNKYERSNK